ncbi:MULTISPECIES: hemagglutinin repeat-containing protein [unclassified Pseudomonas]|uniref:hemagglutinin repeat-containing protein n=1 Tax=unclassified Pseudomonas TaxID=196821 RepID=UPI002113F2A9|nr:MULTISPECIES: hemagglutinin repeat-containing protein [unclassified Pseudomonas]
MGGENKGLIYVAEGPKGKPAAQDFQAGTNGAFTDLATGKGGVPALRYTNPNEKGTSKRGRIYFICVSKVIVLSGSSKINPSPFRPLLQAKNNITLESAQSTANWANDSNNDRTAIGVSFNIGQQNGFTLDLGASIAKSMGAGDSVTQVNSTLDTSSLVLRRT